MLVQQIHGHAVRRVELRDGLVLDLAGSGELIIKGPLRLALPSTNGDSVDQVVIDPGDSPPNRTSLTDLEGATCTRADRAASGRLHLEFSTGHQIDVDVAGKDGGAWSLHSKRHAAMAMPFLIAEKAAALLGPTTHRLWTEATSTAVKATHRILPASHGHSAPQGYHRQSHLDFLDASEMEREMHHL